MKTKGRLATNALLAGAPASAVARNLTMASRSVRSFVSMWPICTSWQRIAERTQPLQCEPNFSVLR